MKIFTYITMRSLFLFSAFLFYGYEVCKGINIHHDESVTLRMQPEPPSNDQNESKFSNSDNLQFNLENDNLQRFFSPSLCTSPKALKYSINLLEELDLGDVDHKKTLITPSDEYSSPISAPSVMSSEPMLHIRLHQFIVNAPPTHELFDNNCFGGEYIQYEKNLGDVTVESNEFRSGCTPFRQKALILSNFRQCLQNNFELITGKLLSMDYVYGILKEMGYHAGKFSLEETEETRQNQEEQTIQNTYKKTVRKWMQKAEKELGVPGGDISSDAAVNNILEQCSLSGAAEAGFDEQDLDDFYKLFRHSLVCYPPFTGSIGVIGHGIYPHNAIDINESKMKKKCNVHPMCARFATSELLNFTQAKYNKIAPFLQVKMRPPSFQTCVAAKKTNCRYYSHCWVEALKHVCSKTSACCPSLKVYEACKDSTKSQGCRNICS